MNACRPEVTPAYGMRPAGGFGIRGFRVFCSDCGHLSRLYDNAFGARTAKEVHRSKSVLDVLACAPYAGRSEAEDSQAARERVT